MRDARHRWPCRSSGRSIRIDSAARLTRRGHPESRSRRESSRNATRPCQFCKSHRGGTRCLECPRNRRTGQRLRAWRRPLEPGRLRARDRRQYELLLDPPSVQGPNGLEIRALGALSPGGARRGVEGEAAHRGEPPGQPCLVSHESQDGLAGSLEGPRSEAEGALSSCWPDHCELR